MPTLDVVVGSDVDLSIRARQVCGMFDCPPQKKQTLRWQAELPLDKQPWSIGMIVGPSGCGKTVCARSLFPKEYAAKFKWQGETVIDSFSPKHSVEAISTALNSVGFSTIPAWLRPHAVLSNGEQFRADIARRLLEQSGVIVVDEFTSVVDRQVACTACHAVQKFVRKNQRQLVAVSCHRDIIDWLQPDWIFEPAERLFRWRSLQRRPEIHIEVARIPYEAWRLFAPFHYLTAELNKSAACFGLWANGQLATFAGVIHRVHPSVRDIRGCSRLVTLPDWQGLGLAFYLSETLGAAYKALGYRFRNYPAHPSFVRAYKPEKWSCLKQAGVYSAPLGTVPCTKDDEGVKRQPGMGSRPCAVMEYVGDMMPVDQARRLIERAATSEPRS